MNENAFEYLSAMPHFSFIPKDEMKKVAEWATPRSYPAGTVYAVQGKSWIDRIYILVKGSLSLFDEKNGNKKLIGHIKSGEVFGGITILMNAGISLRTVVVDKDCEGYTIPKEVFQDLCTRHKSFHDYFLENFSKHIADDSLASIIETGQAKNFLSGLEPFSFLSESEIEQTAAHLRMAKHPKNTVLFVQRQSRVGYLYILQKGSAERYYEENNQKNMYSLLSEGDMYGGISMLLNDDISVRTLRVNEDSCFYLLPKQVFMDICSRNEAFTEYFTDIFGKRMLEKSYASIIAKTIIPREESAQFLNQPVSEICSKPVFCDKRVAIRDTARMMSNKKISSLFIGAENIECAGVVTERDLTRRVIATGYDVMRPVAEIMSAPVRTVSGQAPVFEALLLMMREDIRHLGVTDANGMVNGILSSSDIVEAQGQSPLFLLREIAEADTMKKIIESHKALPGLVKNLITGGAKAENLTKFITTVSDTILGKIMKFVLGELGKPPVQFAFIIMGSEGRKEQTLKTDQDNAIVFEDVPDGALDEVKAYFLSFGERACALLDQAGYAFCKGGVMAKNPDWCQPLSKWRAYFSNWIRAAEAEDLLQASIFFDFRHGYGDANLVDSLRHHLFDSLGGWSGFFRHLTENALHFRPPIGFFRNFIVESKGEHRDTFDMKSAITPVVDFARIYALKNKIEETNTLERLRQLNIKGVLSREEFEEIEKAYGFLMQLRFARQVAAAVDENAKPDNHINPKKMTRIEQKMLKEVFKRVENIQTKINFEFIGIA